MRKAIILLVMLLPIILHSQEIERSVIAAAGGFMQGDSQSPSISWTLGETMTETFTSSALILTQGFQQGNLSETDINTPSLDFGSIAVYPNPVSDNLFMRFETSIPKQFSVVCYDLIGRKVLEQKFMEDDADSAQQISISTTKVNVGMYVLQLVSDGKLIFSTKIIKVDKAN